MGGRGQKSSLSGIPKNKRKSIESYNKRIKEHETKIQNALNGVKGYDKRTIEHWQDEINAFKGNIEKIMKRRKKK